MSRSLGLRIVSSRCLEQKPRQLFAAKKFLFYRKKHELVACRNFIEQKYETESNLSRLENKMGQLWHKS